MKNYSKNELKTILTACTTADEIEILFGCCENEDEVVRIGVLFSELIHKKMICAGLTETIKKFGILRMIEIFESL